MVATPFVVIVATRAEPPQTTEASLETRQMGLESVAARPTHTVTGKMLLAAVMVMQVLNTTCSQRPCSTQSSELQDNGSVNVMFISSCASRPETRRKRSTMSLTETDVRDHTHTVVL